MTKWKKPEIADLPEMRRIIESENAKGSDLSVVNIYLLEKKYNLKIAFEDGFLIRKYKTDDKALGRNGITFPTGNNNSSKDDKNRVRIIDNLIKEMKDNNEEPLMCLVTGQQLQWIKERYPNVTVCFFDGDSDYLYKAEHLAELKGKKNHKKKNHVLKFIKTYPDLRFEIFDSADDKKNDCFKKDMCYVADKWLDERADRCVDSYVVERNEITDAVEKWDELELKGGIIYVGDEPVAMTIASLISKCVYDIHFEKSFGEYACNGGFAAVNRLFAEYLYKKCEAGMINREEDIGEPGLRKAKLSYHPDEMIEKYTVRFN